MVAENFPKLRLLDLSTQQRDGRSFILVKDPQQISKATLLIPQPLASAMYFCDGSRDIMSISAALALHGGVWIPPVHIQKLISALDEQYFLENERFLALKTQMVEAYRQTPFRSSCCAGQVYPNDAAKLKHQLTSYLEKGNGTGSQQSPWSDAAQRFGLISPHIDYSRGGSVYARVWAHAQHLVQEAELVIILGTDHHGSEDMFTLTRQNYATPLGILPTHQGMVDALASALGEACVFSGELRHLGEHSVELAAVWLQFMRSRGRKATLKAGSVSDVEILPVLTGSLSQLATDAQTLAKHDLLNCFLQTVLDASAGMRVLIVAAADLSHVGPAFGGEPLDATRRAELKAADDDLLAKICAGDAAGFYDAICQMEDRNNVCGVTPIYLTLRLMNASRGVQTGYEMCPADEKDTSVVSICGVVFE